MQTQLLSPALWQTLWVLLSVSCLIGGLILTVKGRYPKPVGTAPHCPNCSYNLTGVESKVCPECGTIRQEPTCHACGYAFADPELSICPQCAASRTMDTAVRGERRRRPGMVAAGVVLLAFGLSSCIALAALAAQTTKPIRAPSVSNNIKNAKAILANLRQSPFVSPSTSIQPAPPDSRMALLAVLIQDKIPYTVSKRVANGTVSQAALVQLKAASQFISSTLLPQYSLAAKSGNPRDVKTLLALLDQLDKQMDALLKTLKGY